MAGRYQETHRRSLERPEEFWAEAAAAISWDRPWERVLDDRRAPFYRWFEGGLLNTCYNAVDRHVAAGRGGQRALIYDSPVTGTVTTFSYAELQKEVSALAGALASIGVAAGDRVLVYMPMVPEALFAMLACARIGAIHSVVFGGFAPKELAKRIDDAGPKAILTASCGIEVQRIVPYQPLLEQALAIAAHAPSRVVVLSRPQHPWALLPGRDLDWRELVAASSPADPVSLPATHPLYILYTSGTTGIPKGIVRDAGGHAVALKWSMQHVYGVAPGEVMWAASDIGWAVGHSYIVYGPLLHGATAILYEGKPVGTPDAGAYWRVCAEHGVDVFFTAPTGFRAIRKEDPRGEQIRRHDLSKLRALFLAGERCDPDTLAWAQAQLGIPVIDHWWQTETGWPAISNCLGLELLPVKPGSPAKPVPGYDIRVLGEDGHEAPRGQIGNLAIRLPMPPGTLPTLWQNEEGFRRTYLETYPGYYLTGDAGFHDEDEYLYVMGRVDDIINVAGHRLSTGGMEEVLAGHPAVAECCVVGVHDEIKGQVPVGFVVVKAGVETPEKEIVAELVARVREQIGPIAAFRQAAVVARLPKTRSGKILRGTLQKIADGVPYIVPATIDDPAILGELTEVLSRLGYPKT